MNMSCMDEFIKDRMTSIAYWGQNPNLSATPVGIHRLSYGYCYPTFHSFWITMRNKFNLSNQGPDPLADPNFIICYNGERARARPWHAFTPRIPVGVNTRVETEDPTGHGHVFTIQIIDMDEHTSQCCTIT